MFKGAGWISVRKIILNNLKNEWPETIHFLFYFYLFDTVFWGWSKRCNFALVFDAKIQHQILLILISKSCQNLLKIYLKIGMVKIYYFFV